MAEVILSPEMESFAEAAGDAALGPFQAADFDADPSAAFSDGMGAAMDYMSDAGMPTEMMDAIQDLGTAAFDAHMEANPDSSPMDAFDAVGGAVDMYMADFPGDMPCMDIMDAGMPPMPDDMGSFMDTCPPYGDHPGGDSFDMGAMPDHYPGPMTDMPMGEPGDVPPPTGEGDPAMGSDVPPGDVPPPTGEGDPAMGGGGPEYGPATPPPDGSPTDIPPTADMDGDGMPPPPPGGEEGLAFTPHGEGAPGEGDMPPGDPGMVPPVDDPGMAPPVDDPSMAAADSHMHDAGAATDAGSAPPPTADDPAMDPGMAGDVPPPTDDTDPSDAGV